MSSSNKRKSPRRPAKGGAKVVCRKGQLGLGANLALQLLDVSEGGVRLILKEPLPAGQEVEVVLNPPGGGKEAKCKGVVVWCLETAEAKHCVGVRFEKSMSYATLTDLWKM